MESTAGDVRLTAQNGSIIDGDVELFRPADEGFVLTYNDLSEALKEDYNNGIFSLDSVSYPVSPGLMKFLFPHTEFRGVPQTTTAVETANIIGANVTLIAGGNSGSVGRRSGKESLDLANDWSLLSNDQKELLATATAEDVIGAHYELYVYTGSTTSGVDLSTVSFTGNWQKINVNHVTNLDRSSSQTVAIRRDQTVLVQYDANDFGLYRFLQGSSATDTNINLATESFADSSRWVRIDADHATDDVGTATLVNGEIVQNKRVIERLAIQLFDDVDIEASTSLSIDAGGAVVIGTTGDFLIDHIKTGDMARIIADGSILDLGTDTEAAISAFGDVILGAGTSIEASNHTAALRLQLSPTTKLSVDVFGNLRLQQVDDDLSSTDFNAAVTGIGTLAINDLIAYRINAGGVAEIEVVEGDLYLGRVTSGTSVDLRAESDILDYLDDSASPVVNIFTGDVTGAATGNVYLQTTNGNVGTATNFVEVEIRKGDLDAQVQLNSWIRSVRDLNIGDFTSVDGNVTLQVDGQANVGLITASGNGVADATDSLTDGLVTISATTSIVDRFNNTTPNIVATGVLLNAGLGAGSSTNPLDTQVSRLEANVSGGGLWLINTGSLQIGMISSVVGVQALNTISILTTGSISVDEAIDSAKWTDPAGCHVGYYDQRCCDKRRRYSDGSCRSQCDVHSRRFDRH